MKKTYFEVRPGFDTVRYLFSFGLLTWLAKSAVKRPQRLFVEIQSSIDRHVLSEGLYEKGIIELLRDLIMQTGRCEHMIDIGANIGNHTVALAPLFKKVDAVEPHPVLFRILEANTIRNGFGHVTCHNFGLAGEDTTATLTESASNHGLSRVRERSQLAPEVFGLSAESFGSEFAIDLKSAADFVGRLSETLDRTFIKIDVEGMEQEIVTAIIPLLHKYKPLVGFEWFTKSQAGFTKLIQSLDGYEIWGIRMHDVGKNLLWRACKMLFTGRRYTYERIDLEDLDDVYPLAILVPKGG